MKYIIAVLISISILGCATINPPRNYQLPGPTDVKLAQKEVMNRVMSWCMKNGFTVKSKSDDMLYATSDLTQIQSVEQDFWVGKTFKLLVADCGDSPGVREFVSGEGELNVIVAAKDASTSTVQVTFNAKPERGTIVQYCSSKGVIENMILNELK